MNSNKKFRVWCVSAKCWDNQILETRPITRILESTDYIVQQWTGLFDKNNVCIFEGDIIQYRYGSHQAPYYDKVIVEWMNENDGYDYSGWKLCDVFIQGGPFEVIGNILENPKLLQK